VALDSLAPLNRLVAVLEALPGMQAVYVGVPESPGSQVVAYIALAGQRTVVQPVGVLRRDANYFIGFAYAVEGAEASAETTLAAWVDALAVALTVEKRTDLAGTCDAMDWDFSLGDSPTYQPIAGREFRVFPVLVTVTQSTTF